MNIAAVGNVKVSNANFYSTFKKFSLIQKSNSF